MEKSKKAPIKKGEAADPAAAKREALAQAMAKIEKSYGRGAVMKLGDDSIEDVDVIPTGSIGLNYALGVGGFPRGRVIEIYGPESSGKTTLAIHAIAEAQKRGGTAAIIDAEHALTVFTPRNLAWMSTISLSLNLTTENRLSKSPTSSSARLLLT